MVSTMEWIIFMEAPQYVIWIYGKILLPMIIMMTASYQNHFLSYRLCQIWMRSKSRKWYFIRWLVCKDQNKPGA